MKGKLRKYVALLRGINVGGHHKMPMAELRKTMEGMGFSGVKTLLASGNVVFESIKTNETTLEETIAAQLEKTFGFPVPVLIRNSEEVFQLLEEDPFKHVEMHKDIRLYVTFTKEKPKADFSLPWTSLDGTYKILELKERAIYSVLDISVSKTIDAMDILGKIAGNGQTTRNWNTIVKIGKLF